MGDPKPGVVFVGHDASRTGAPILGLTFLRWLVATHPIDLRIALLAPGPLVADHHALAPTSVASAPGALRLAAARVGGERWAGAPPPVPAGSVPDLAIANSLAALPAAARLGAGRLACWVHELDGVADRVLDPAHRRELLPQVHHFVAAGGRVAAMLTDRWHIAADRVTTVDPFVGPDGPRPNRIAISDAARPTILGSGSLVARKGADAFVATLAALAVSRDLPPAAWVGGDPSSPFGQQVRTDIDDAHLVDRVEVVAEVADLGPWWPEPGVFLHTAREDPFPLVAIEAARRGLPVLTWDTGGAADLVRRAGLDHLVAPAGDLLGLVDRLASLLDHPERAAEAGARLRGEAERLTAEHQGPLVWAACTGEGP